MEKDMISIVVPVYNLENYIERCVESILHQTYTNIEVILVNDGSKDNSLSIMNRMKEKDARIKVIHQENQGVTAARLHGVKKSSGEWIGFVDGDDIIDSDMYERLLNNARKYNAQISHCGYKMVFPSRVDYYYNTGKFVEQDTQQGLYDLLSGNYIEPGLYIKIYKRELFNTILDSNVMDRSIKNTEDLLMNYYLFKESKKSVYEDFCPYHYMIRKGSAATASLNKNKLEDPLKVLTLIKKECLDSSLIQVINTRLLGVLISLSTLYDGQSDFIRPYRMQARKNLKALLKEIDSSLYDSRIIKMAAWASISPFTYYCVHKMYARLKGTDRKYSVE